MKITIQGIENVTRGLGAMAGEIPQASQMLLTRAAEEAKVKMMAEAPKNTGALSRSITISAPDQFTRFIEPTARNFAPGNQYGLPVEEGSRSGYVPNPVSIGQYFGVDKKVAWAIALSIARRGTPANPFVSRTFSWIRSMIGQRISPFVSQITMQFKKGTI